MRRLAQAPALAITNADVAALPLFAHNRGAVIYVRQRPAR